jgi:hypothetical protein
MQVGNHVIELCAAGLPSAPEHASMLHCVPQRRFTAAWSVLPLLLQACRASSASTPLLALQTPPQRSSRWLSLLPAWRLPLCRHFIALF